MPPSFDLAVLCKEKGNAAFKNEDYQTARSLYTHALSMDPLNETYPLNRAMANLKLERWSEAEVDCTTTLKISPGHLKAIFRRVMARRELGKYKQANEDLDLFINGGGDRLLAAQARESLSNHPAENIDISPLTTPNPTDHLANEFHAIRLAHEGNPFTIRDSNTQRGCCALATKKIRRGDLILSEKPVIIVSTETSTVKLQELAIQSELRGLSPTHLNSFLHLSNGHADCSCFPGQRPIGIFSTNSFALTDDRSGIGLTACRFNHACSPNARFSFNPKTGHLRIFALSDIVVDEEICVAYLSSRTLYGQTRQHRQGLLHSRFHFTCSCLVCTLPKAEMILSDSRRVKVNELWEKVPKFRPNQTSLRLNTIVQAIKLLKEEGYAADYDDFTNDAALICAYHSDYESSKYWAKLTYETRVAEFGEDSPRAAEVRGTYLNPKLFSMAGAGRVQRFSHIRL